MEQQFPLSEAISAYFETDNDGLSAYVVTTHREGWRMRTDAPNEMHGEWMTKADRRRWAINEMTRQRKAISHFNARSQD